VPPNIDLAEIEAGRYYFLTGFKGSGKTALLRYLAETAKARGTATTFVLFKSDFSEFERQELSRAAGFTLMATGSGKSGKGRSSIEQDFEHVWRLFLHQQLAELLARPQDAVIKDANLDRYIKILRASETGAAEGVLGRLFGSIRDGRIKVAANFSFLKAEFSTNFQPSRDGADEGYLSVASLVDAADRALAALRPANGRAILFLDELEVSFSMDDQYVRDCKMIRDLIVCVEKINRQFIEKKLPIIAIAAIRSEVVTAVSAVGKEINKAIEDFGVKIYWHRRGTPDEAHPLLQVILQKIQASEVAKGINEDRSVLWEKYFPASYKGMNSSSYLLHYTWYRPRDVVRLLRAAQEFSPTATVFNEHVIDECLREYAKGNLVEIFEDLQATYTPFAIEGIKALLTGLPILTNLSALEARLVQLAKSHSSVKELKDKHSLPVVLSDLFRVGLIGNVYRGRGAGKGGGTRQRWSFRGEENIDLSMGISVHRAAGRALSIS